MDPVKKKLTKKTSKLGKEKRVKRNDAFRKRQGGRCTVFFFSDSTSVVDKTWLETHIWHAKRMHMENLWGYRLVSGWVASSEKQFILLLGSIPDREVLSTLTQSIHPWIHSSRCLLLLDGRNEGAGGHFDQDTGQLLRRPEAKSWR